MAVEVAVLRVRAVAEIGPEAVEREGVGGEVLALCFAAGVGVPELGCKELDVVSIHAISFLPMLGTVLGRRRFRRSRNRLLRGRRRGRIGGAFGVRRCDLGWIGLGRVGRWWCW